MNYIIIIMLLIILLLILITVYKCNERKIPPYVQTGVVEVGY